MSFHFTKRGDLTIPPLIDLAQDAKYRDVCPVLDPVNEYVGRGYVTSCNTKQDWSGLPSITVDLYMYFTEEMYIKKPDPTPPRATNPYVRKHNYGLDKNSNHITLDLTLECRSSDMYSAFDIPTIFYFKVYEILHSPFEVWKYYDVNAQTN